MVTSKPASVSQFHPLMDHQQTLHAADTLSFAHKGYASLTLINMELLVID